MAHYSHAPLSPTGSHPAQYSYPETDLYPPGIQIDRYTGGRTPSPTPSEIEASSKLFDVKKYLNWRFWARKAWIPWYIITALILVLAILISVFDKQIVRWLTPAGRWMRALPAGWLIPIAILFVISFPPLFGHEIIAILVGVIWGLGVGFAIVGAGTFLGEVGNYYAFKYCCRARGEKMEKTNILYGCLARVVREGGFRVALIIRLSVIPGHFSTAVFSTCGMSVLVFALAAFFSLPKQLIYVYLGVILEESGSGTQTTRDQTISRIVLAVTILITIVACWWIWHEINRVKPAVIYDRRKARQVKMANPAFDMDNGSTATLNPQAFASESELPLSVNQQPAQFPLRNVSGGYAGYGGYGPSYVQGRYGEFIQDDERKSTEALGWETRDARIVDIRGMPLGGAPKPVPVSDDEGNREESAVNVRIQEPVLPPALPSPGPGHEIPYQQQQSRQLTPAVNVQSARLSLPSPFEDNAGVPIHRFQLSDPPVAAHTPLPSDSTYGYPPSDALLENSSQYTHSLRPSDATYDSQYPLTAGHAHQRTDTTFRSIAGGHAAEATDASYYTAAASPPHSPFEPPNLPPVRVVSPMTLRDQTMYNPER